MKNIEPKYDKIGTGEPANNEKIFASEINSISSELENAVSSSGQTLDEANNYQLARSMADHALGARHSVDTGTVNNYILSQTGSRYAPTTLVDGYVLEFFTGNANTTTTPTLNYATLGVKTIVAQNGTSPVVVGDIKVGVLNTVKYDGTNWRLILPVVNIASETVLGGIKISTSAQALAATDDTTAMTPKKVFEKLSAAKEVTTITSSATINGTPVKNGYTIFYDISTGAVVRKEVFGWAINIGNETGIDILLPITFTAFYNLSATIANASPNNDATPDQPARIRSLSLTSIRVSNSSNTNSIDVSYSITGI